MRIQKEKIYVLGLNLCRECKGDWFTPIIVTKQVVGKTIRHKAWQCNNCAAIYIREMDIPSLVTRDELQFLPNVRPEAKNENDID